MEAAPQRAALWSTAQAYIIAICCLLLGVSVGYLLRSNRPAPTAAARPQAAARPAAAQQPTPEQIQHMADQQVEPLLAKLKTSGDDPELLSEVAASYYAARQYKSAASYFERLVAVQPSAKNLIILGNTHYYAQEPEKALADFQRAVALEPGAPDALFNIGIIRWQFKNDPQGAIQAWQALLKANPKHPRRAEVEEMIVRAKQHISRTPSTAAAIPAK